MESNKQPASMALSDDKQPKLVANAGTDAPVIATYSTVDASCILFGRGKACNNHTGNQRMRLFIDKYRDDYQSAGRGEKKMLVRTVYEELVEAGMKFLKQEDGIAGWIEANADEAIKKVGHSIRCHRSRYQNDAGTKDRPTVARVVSAASESDAAVRGQMVDTDLGEGFREQLASPLAVLSMPSAARAGWLSSGNLGNQEILGSTLSMAPNPLLSLGSIPAQMDQEIRLSMASNPLLSIGGIPRQMDQAVMGSTLSVASNPLLSLGSIPMQMDLLYVYAGTSPSMGLIASPAVGFRGLSSVDLYVMIERERELRRQAMLYHHILRNTEQR